MYRKLISKKGMRMSPDVITLLFLILNPAPLSKRVLQSIQGRSIYRNQIRRVVQLGRIQLSRLLKCGLIYSRHRMGMIPFKLDIKFLHSISLSINTGSVPAAEMILPGHATQLWKRSKTLSEESPDIDLPSSLNRGNSTTTIRTECPDNTGLFRV